MATSTDTLITNAKNYASSAVGAALSAITEIETLADTASSLPFAKAITPFDFKIVSEEAQKLYSKIRSTIPTPLPVGIGVFSDIGPVPTHTPKDFQELRDLLKNVVSTLETVPDRFKEAADLFELVSSVLLNRIESATEVTQEEVDSLLEVKILEEEDKLPEFYDDIIDKYAVFGHRYPPGEMVRIAKRGIKAKTRELSSYNREITGRYASISAETREHYVNEIIRLASSQIRIGQGKYRAIGSAGRVLADTVLTDNILKDAEFKMYELRFKKEAALQEILVDIYKSDLLGWSAKFDAMTKVYAVKQQADIDSVSSVHLGGDKSIEEAKMKIEGVRMDIDMGTRGILSRISVLSQKVASALSSLNTLVGQISELTED